MTITLSTRATTAPHCDECDTELHRAGTGTPRYWVCRYCGSATPIAEA